jgi:hypothetical protein
MQEASHHLIIPKGKKSTDIFGFRLSWPAEIKKFLVNLGDNSYKQ